MRPWVIYVSFWYRYSVARRHRRCTSQSIAVRHDKPVGHKTEISQPPKYNAAINRNRNSPLPFNRNAEGEGRRKKWIAGNQYRSSRDETGMLYLPRNRDPVRGYLALDELRERAIALERARHSRHLIVTRCYATRIRPLVAHRGKDRFSRIHDLPRGSSTSTTVIRLFNCT